MPGTVQVSVLEFKGPSSSSHSNVTLLKVSMGKRVFQTRDIGDFSFPLTTLRDNLVVTLVDTAENEIAHTGIQTMEIIEKGCWDDTFSLEGGGHVHMKLKFVLSEEERSRIRVMRESAMKKKNDTNSGINLRHPEIISSTAKISMPNEPEASDSQGRFTKIEVISHEVVAPQTGSLAKSATSSVQSWSDYQNREGSTLESAIPNATDRSEGASSSAVIHAVKSQFPQVNHKESVEKLEIHVPLAPVGTTPVCEQDVASKSECTEEQSEKSASAISKMLDEPIHKNEEQGPMDQISSNEGRPRKVPSVQSQLNKARKADPLQNQDSIIDRSENPSSKELDDHLTTGIIYQTPASFCKRTDNLLGDTGPSHVVHRLESSATTTSSKGKKLKFEDVCRASQGEPTVKEQKNFPIDLIRPSILGSATSSEKLLENQSAIAQSKSFSYELLDSSDSPSVEKRGRRTGLKDTTILNIQVASNQKPKSLECYKEEYHTSETSGMWIFPDNMRRLCITTAGKKVMKILGHHRIEATTLQEKESSESQMTEKSNLQFRTERETRKGQKKLAKWQESGSGSSPDDASSGIVGQKPGGLWELQGLSLEEKT